MKSLKSFLSIFAISVMLFQTIWADDVYTKTTLPSNFFIKSNLRRIHAINDNGMVAGYIGSFGHELAAIWDNKNGIKTLPLPNSPRSIATTVNDKGLVALELCDVAMDRSSHKASRTILWNTNTSEIKYGPVGVPFAINNNGIVLICEDPIMPETFVLWDSRDNSIEKIRGSGFSGVDNVGRPFSEFGYCQAKGDSYITFDREDIMWFYDGKNHLLSPLNDGTKIRRDGAPIRLNNTKDVVVAFSQDNKIVKWQRNKKETKSNDLNLGSSEFVFLGYSNSGKILVGEMVKVENAALSNRNIKNYDGWYSNLIMLTLTNR